MLSTHSSYTLSLLYLPALSCYLYVSKHFPSKILQFTAQQNKGFFLVLVLYLQGFILCNPVFPFSSV